MSFWSQSGASLIERREQCDKQNPGKEKIRPDKRWAEESFVPHVRYLENAYGSLSFWVKDGKIMAQAARKQEFQETVFHRSEEKLTDGHCRTEDKEEGRFETDSLYEDRSCVNYTQYQQDGSPECVFAELKRQAMGRKQQTLWEMISENPAVEGKVLKTLRSTAEEKEKTQELHRDYSRRNAPLMSRQDREDPPPEGENPDENSE